MNTNMPTDPKFNDYYQKHLKLLKLSGFQPKTIEAYSRALRRIGNFLTAKYTTYPLTNFWTTSTIFWQITPGVPSSLICMVL